MPQTADNVAEDYNISREDQDAFAARSQARWAAAHEAGMFRKDEITPVTIPQRKGDPILVVDTDEHPRPGTTASTSLPGLRGVNGPRPDRDGGQCVGCE